ncbi:hypothetical protein F7734_14765 [Scytonema sp. UIC 10036]|uniref:hypothetical protein n=1 Tax=Scytonema sp. UIC 10036 TaxID=2304196 RepID=UPI0012DAC5E4|nr:hypothetical protein [Scytonema sp. UIC 10036]MUG93617.1 hypothetical protein [Scytonema sp. UIC 10036]
MKYKLDNNLLRKLSFEKKIEELKNEIAKINEQINSSKYSLSNNYTPSKNYSLEDISLRNYKLRLESRIEEIENEIAKINETDIKERQIKSYKWIDEKNNQQEDYISLENKPSNLYSDSHFGYSQYQKVNPNGSKPSSPDKPKNTILFWLIALLLVIYFLFHQGSNEKQQPKQQDYSQDISALSSE